jgi:hypothetical protein
MDICAYRSDRRQNSKWPFLVLIFVLFTVVVGAQNDAVKIPDEIKPFIEKGMVPIAIESADLNADGRKDFVVVLSKIIPEGSVYDEAGDSPRPTLVLLRDGNGNLSVISRNERVAYCRNCGGVFGDPFAGLSVRGTKFTIDNYGGSNDRWSVSFTFGYSSRDRNWELVRVEESTFRATDPGRTTRTHIYTPPKNFGLITFADFDPDNYLRKDKK